MPGDAGAYRRAKGKAKLAKLVLMQERGNTCSICGLVSKSPRMFHFDHRNPREKTANVSTLLVGSQEALQAEVAKCDMLCANCHAERTEAQADGIAARIAEKHSLRRERREGAPLSEEEKLTRSFMVMRDKRGLFSLEPVEEFIRASKGWRAAAMAALKARPITGYNRKARLESLKLTYGWAY